MLMLKELLFNEVKSDPDEISCKYKYSRNLTQMSWWVILCLWGGCQESLQIITAAFSFCALWSRLLLQNLLLFHQCEYAVTPVQTQSEVRHQQPSGLHLYFILLVPPPHTHTHRGASVLWAASECEVSRVHVLWGEFVCVCWLLFWPPLLSSRCFSLWFCRSSNISSIRGGMEPGISIFRDTTLSAPEEVSVSTGLPLPVTDH